MNIANVVLPQACAHLIQRQLTMADINSLLDFRQDIFLGLADPDWVRPEIDEIQWAQSRLGLDGRCTALFEPSGALVAYASIYFPRHISLELGVPPVGMLENSSDRISIIDSCMVHPQYRGNGLQRSLILARFKTAEITGRSLCLAFTSPANDASRHNLISCGLSICWIGQTLVTKRTRQILVRDLPLVNGSYGPVIWVPCHDIEQQRILTLAGYRGFCEMPGTPLQIGYATPGVAHSVLV